MSDANWLVFLGGPHSSAFRLEAQHFPRITDTSDQGFSHAESSKFQLSISFSTSTVFWLVVGYNPWPPYALKSDIASNGVDP